MIVVIFRARIRKDANLDEFGALAQRMYELVSTMPGFRGVKDYLADDGEAVTIAEFDTLEQVAAWKNHAEHVVAQQRGRNEFLQDYRIQVCEEAYSYGLDRPQEAQG
jgi:heme-degrading monooxygenase HmoA